MVAVVATCAQGGKNGGYLGCVRMRVSGPIWFHQI
jgi:hypothetical protein